MKAFAAINLTNADYKSPLLPWLGKAEVVPGKPFAPEFSSALEDVLRRNAAVIKFCEQGARFEWSRYPIQLTNATTPLPHLRDLKNASKVLALRGLSLANSGDGKAACENLIETLLLIRSLEREPLGISQIVRSGCFDYALKELEEIVNRVSIPEQSRQDLEDVLDRMEKEDADGVHYMRALTGDRIMWNEFFKMSLADQTVIFWDGGPDRTRGEMEALLEKNPRSDDLQLINRGLDEIQARWLQPYPARLTVSEICSARAREATNLNYLLSAYVFDGANMVDTSVNAEARGVASLRLAQTALALERYRIAHHDSYPQLLSDLVPEYLPKPVLDPFTGKPLQYRRVGKGYVLQDAVPRSDKLDRWESKKRNSLEFAVIKPPTAAAR
ncbi:MAG: hypothetical protein JWM68_5006 [Verrucomicrobiales bacterium]|nr:hypothetical protein [Verrucomicrobiales bacterium]